MYDARVAILSLGSVASFDFVQNDSTVEGSVEIRRSIESAVEPLQETSSARAGFESGGCTDNISGSDGTSEDEHGFDDGFDAEFDLDEFWAKEAASREDVHAADEDEDPEPEPAVETCSVVHVRTHAVHTHAVPAVETCSVVHVRTHAVHTHAVPAVVHVRTYLPTTYLLTY